MAVSECRNSFTNERGEELLCALPLGHEGMHESQDWEWWNDESNSLTIHPELVTGRTKNWKPALATLQLLRIQERIDAHIRTAPEREQETLRRANAQQVCRRNHVSHSLFNDLIAGLFGGAER